MSKLGDKILAAAPERLACQDVTDLLGAWADLLDGERVFLRELTGVERDEYEAYRVRLRYDAEGKLHRDVCVKNLRARLVAIVLVDARGERLFPDADKLGAAAAGELLDQLFEQAQKISGLFGRVPLKNGPGTDSSSASEGNSVAPAASCSTPAPAANCPTGAS